MIKKKTWRFEEKKSFKNLIITILLSFLQNMGKDSKTQAKGAKGGDKGGKTYSARPPKKEKQIDPDNPFAAALMGLKQGD